MRDRLDHEIDISPAALSFIDALDTAARISTYGDLQLLINKPHKWQREYRAWLICGEPMDESESGWNEWMMALDAIEAQS